MITSSMKESENSSHADSTIFISLTKVALEFTFPNGITVD